MLLRYTQRSGLFNFNVLDPKDHDRGVVALLVDHA